MSDKRAILNISERLLFEVSIVRHFIFLKITVKGVDFMNFIISGKKERFSRISFLFCILRTTVEKNKRICMRNGVQMIRD